MLPPLNPKTQALVEAYLASGAPPIHRSTVAEARAQSASLRQLLGDGPALAEVRDVVLPTPTGDVEARLYRPAGDVLATIVYLHGGGWVLGSMDSYDPMLRMLARDSGCRIYSVAYRLAPEAPFPAGLDDAYAALSWLSRQDEATPVVIAGDSAGANLAAVCAIRARDRGGPRLAMQVLLHPATECSAGADSYRRHGDDPLLGTADMRWFWDHYVPDEALRTHPEVSPLRTENLAGLPPAYVLTSEYDVLGDDGRAYATRLAEAGTPTTARHCEDEAHDFIVMVNYLPSADRAVGEVAVAIRERLAGKVTDSSATTGATGGTGAAGAAAVGSTV